MARYKAGDKVVVPSISVKRSFEVYKVIKHNELPPLYILKKKAPAVFYEDELL